jgi:hypothetical protein
LQAVPVVLAWRTTASKTKICREAKLLFASAATGRDRSHQEGTVAEPFCMIRGAVGGDSHKPTYHWSFCQSPVASMVPGFVLMPLVTLSFPKGDGGDPV